jgi:hypothetical protein
VADPTRRTKDRRPSGHQLLSRVADDARSALTSIVESQGQTRTSNQGSLGSVGTRGARDDGQHRGGHLPLHRPDLDAEAERLRQPGATEVRRNQWHSTESIILRDIEGNEFDLVAE